MSKDFLHWASKWHSLCEIVRSRMWESVTTWCYKMRKAYLDRGANRDNIFLIFRLSVTKQTTFQTDQKQTGKFLAHMIILACSIISITLKLFGHNHYYLYSLWGSRGKYTGVVCHSLLQVDHVLSELSTMTCPSWVALHGMALSLSDISFFTTKRQWSVKGITVQYFGHLMQTVDSLEKSLMLGKFEDRRREGHQRMRWLDGISDAMDMYLGKFWEMVSNREAWHAAVRGVTKSRKQLGDWTTMNSNTTIIHRHEVNVKRVPGKKKRESSRKTSISALLTMPKPLTVWITVNCGKFLKSWEYQTTWPASWETCIQVRKQQLELDMEQ